MKALLKYPGAKWRLAPWIISHFPDHHSYLEPFFGSGAVLFNKPKSNIETVNDLDDEVINFFECIRSIRNGWQESCILLLMPERFTIRHMKKQMIHLKRP